MKSAQELRQSEERFIETIRPHFESSGYKFYVYPKKNQLPSFMGTYTPDAIAIKPGNNIAIEVKIRRNSANEVSTKTIRNLFYGHPEWHFRVYYIAESGYEGANIPPSDPELFFARIAAVRDLLACEQNQAAFLMSWSLLEAAARMSEPDLKGRPQSPGTIVQALAMSGKIEPETERSLRNLIELRNRVAHGDLAAEPNFGDTNMVLSVAKSLSEIRDGG